VSRAAGFSLGELLVGTLLAALAAVTLLAQLSAARRAQAAGERACAVQQATRAGLDLMARTLAEAVAIEAAHPDRFALRSGNGERVEFVLVGTTLYRGVQLAGSERPRRGPVVDGIRRLALRYFDRSGREIAPGGPRDAIRRIRVELVGHPGYRLAREVAPRNLAGG
jgi:hypothetical protein